MDITEKSPTILSLCSGYGGIEIGLNRIFGEVAVLAHVEIEAFAVANLVDKMETGQMVPAPIWTDVKTFNGYALRDCVDLITGGYPCQPFSAAGKRAGTDDPRHLWPHIKRIVGECRARWVFFENVEGHISLGISEVLADLEEMGYTVTAGIFSASEVGAPHQRKRVFILGKLGHAEGNDERWVPDRTLGTGVKTGRPGVDVANPHSIDWGPSSERRVDDGKAGRSSEELADSRSEGLERHAGHEYRAGRADVRQNRPATPSGVSLWPARPGEIQHDWEAPRVVADSRCIRPAECEQQTTGVIEPGTPRGQTRQAKPGLGRTVNGPANRVDRLRLLGNGVVPQVAEKAFRTLYQELQS